MSDEKRKKFAELVLRVKERRDQKAFAELFDYFAPRIKAYLLAAGAQSAAAEEITQEVMTALWLKTDMYDPAKASLSTWLFRIARNRHIDVVRKHASQIIDPEEPMLLPADTPSPSDGLHAAEREKLVASALSQLQDEQRKMVRLAFFAGLSQSEIAAKTGLPLGTVKSRTRLAFEKLRHVLAEHSSFSDI